MRIVRRVWRHVPRGAEPLHLQWIQLARGRWNTQRPRLSCLYTALTQQGALAEYRKHFLDAGFAATSLAPRDLVSIDVRVEPVLDLTDDSVLVRLGLDSAALVGDRNADRAVCRRAAWAAVRDGYRAILAPSAALPGERTLMLYPESHQGKLVVRNGPDRIPINYGGTPLFP